MYFRSNWIVFVSNHCFLLQTIWIGARLFSYSLGCWSKIPHESHKAKVLKWFIHFSFYVGKERCVVYRPHLLSDTTYNLWLLKIFLNRDCSGNPGPNRSERWVGQVILDNYLGIFRPLRALSRMVPCTPATSASSGCCSRALCTWRYPAWPSPFS